ncbi:amino acid adenylation domain-containing protein [Janthinobacterium sp. GB4P2]|uniref:amino acid adenylation domain-containing protein n=1 Tax=Janthinobacterium sp. GB4P2 TaxID=3424189 RepID=UPI003F252ABC
MSLERKDIITALTPEKRAAVLQALKNKGLHGQGAVLKPRARQGDTAPVSPSQQSLWVLEQMHGSGAYNELAAFRIEGEVNVGVLERALQTITQRHEILRTTFPTIAGEVVQKISAAVAVELKVISLSGLGHAEQDHEVALHVAHARASEFDLELGPLFRLELLQRSNGVSVLLVAAHHIVLDGWSIGIFRSELSALYQAFLDGTPSPLAPLSIQYADYAIWQRLETERHEKQLTYWKEQLADIPPLLNLSVAKPRPAEPTNLGARHYFSLSQDLTDRIKKLSQDEGVTLFMTLLAGFQIMLHRYSQQTVIPVGSAVANRNHPDLERLIGYFINTVVMRGDFTQDESVSQFIRRTGETAVAAFDHQEVPFQSVVDTLQPQRSSNHHPLFQVAFNLQNTPKAEQANSSLQLIAEDMHQVSAKFDLILWMEDRESGLRGYWEYSADLFDAPTLDQMCNHLQSILGAMAEQPTTPVSSLPMLSSRERTEMLVDWNANQVPAPTDPYIHRRIESLAQRTPSAHAVTHDGVHLTYYELNQRANILAHHLRRQGLLPGMLVGLFVDRSCEMIVALLAVLKAGAAYIPFDPTYPAARNAEVVVSAKPSIVLTQRKILDRLPPVDATVVCLEDAVEQNLAALADLSLAIPSDSPAYVIFTSGSTGAPKGVVVSHRNLLFSTTARQHYYAHPPSSYLLLSSIAFDSSAAGIFWTLSEGGLLVIPAEERLHDIAYLNDLIATNRVTHFLTIPAFHSELLRAALPSQLTSLKTVVLAGDVCSPSIVAQHFHKLPLVELFNEYGPTECTVWSTVHACSRSMNEQIVPVGRPIPYTQAYILDQQQRLLPVGVRGELYIGGEGVAQGYLNRQDLTAQKFVNLVIDGIDLGRVYRTGDVACWRPDGTIEIHGRTDQQVKVRGYRIELGDIEAALKLHPGVDEAIARLDETSEGVKRLSAFVTRTSNADVSIDELYASLRERLPAYAVPSMLQMAVELPKLPNGKIDRSRLPSTLVEPALSKVVSPMEQLIIDIWKETLKLQQVNVDDDFFKIGGDSLLMIRVYNQLRDACEVSLPIVELFKHPTPRLLAEKISPAAVPQDEWSPLERSIADIWKTVLKLEDVGRHDDFFKIGGDSLLMIRVYNQLRTIVDTSIPIIELFKHPTPSSLATLLSADTVVGII